MEVPFQSKLLNRQLKMSQTYKGSLIKCNLVIPFLYKKKSPEKRVINKSFDGEADKRLLVLEYIWLKVKPAKVSYLTCAVDESPKAYF